MYYLQSRYYDPRVGRFLNADGLISTGQGLLGNNMFAYCGNNPVNYVDPTGISGIWYYLFQEFKFGLLHSFVEIHLLATHQYVGDLTREYNVATGRADIVNLDTGDVWEIKHGRNESCYDERISQAFTQLKKYLGHGGITQPGPAGTFNGQFVVNCMDVSYRIQYTTPSAGVILYTVTELNYYVTNPYHVYVPTHQSATSRNTSAIAGAGLAFGMFYVLGMYDRIGAAQ